MIHELYNLYHYFRTTFVHDDGVVLYLWSKSSFANEMPN